MSKSKLFILVGFLGSGKTTLIKKLLDTYSDYKVGVLVNDFGETNVDFMLLKSQYENVLDVSNGSIFCSCRSDQFVKKIIELSTLNLDYIFVEGSGLANPNTILKVLDLIKIKSDNKIIFKGTIGLVDAENIHKIITTNIIKNQLKFSDVILLNKIDLVDNDILDNQIELIRGINQTASIIPTTYSEINKSILDNLHPAEHSKNHFGIELNTQKYTLDTKQLSIKDIERFCTEISDKVHRIKGFKSIEGQTYYIEYINGAFYKTEITKHYPDTLVVLSMKSHNIEKLTLDILERII